MNIWSKKAVCWPCYCCSWHSREKTLLLYSRWFIDFFLITLTFHQLKNFSPSLVSISAVCCFVSAKTSGTTLETGCRDFLPFIIIISINVSSWFWSGFQPWCAGWGWGQGQNSKAKPNWAWWVLTLGIGNLPSGNRINLKISRHGYWNSNKIVLFVCFVLIWTLIYFCCCEMLACVTAV